MIILLLISIFYFKYFWLSTISKIENFGVCFISFVALFSWPAPFPDK